MVTALAEVCDTQAAMNLLGFESEVSSHSFKYLHAWPAVGYQNSINTNGPQSVQSNDISESVSDTCKESGQDEDDTENLQHETDFDSDKVRNKRCVYVDHQGQAHAISQCDLYRFRVANWDMDYVDPGCTDVDIEHSMSKPKVWEKRVAHEQQCGLRNFSLLQFVMHVTLKKMPPEGKLSKNKSTGFRLNSACPLHKSHYLQLNNRASIPILAGRTRPCPPAHNKPKRGKAKRRWEVRANRFARYMGAILFPWDQQGDCGVHDWNQLQLKVCELKQSHHKRDHHSNKILYLDAFHLQYLNQVPSNIRSSEEMQSTLHEWGSEFAQRFSRGSIETFNGDGSECDQHMKLATTLKEIQNLVNEATAAHAIAAMSTDAVKAKQFLCDMKTDMDKLYIDFDTRTSARGHKIDTIMSDSSQKYDKSWANKRCAVLNKDEMISTPIRKPNPLGTKRNLSSSALQKLKTIRHELSINTDWLKAFDQVTKTWINGQQLLLFIHGGAGTGKTTLARAIIKAAQIFNLEHRFSATSGVAGLLNNGTTIHHLLAQQGELTGSKPNVNKIRLRNGNAHLILIDEVCYSVCTHNTKFRFRNRSRNI